MHKKSPEKIIAFEKNKKKYFLSLSIFQQSQLLINSTNKIRKEIMHSLKDFQIIEIFRYLDPDEIVDMLQVLPKYREKIILNRLSDSQKEKINFLSKFAPDSAAGVMSLNYIIVTVGTNKKEIENRINEHLKKTKKEPTILVVDERGFLKGELKISSMLLKNRDSLYDSLNEVPTISSHEDQETCIQRFKKHSGENVVVLDERDFILGIINAKEMLKIVEQENEEDYFALAGLNKEEDIGANPREKVNSRLSWLVVNLITAFMAAAVVSIYEETIAKYVLLAVFMPVIAGMGGNAGTQTTAILIRGIALDKINSSFHKILLYETLGALINGIAIGLIVAFVAILFGSSSIFAIIAFAAIVLNLVAASFFGTVIPMILKKFGVDPAVASNIFVTTITDVFGFFIFLGMASLFLI